MRRVGLVCLLACGCGGEVAVSAVGGGAGSGSGAVAGASGSTGAGGTTESDADVHDHPGCRVTVVDERDHPIAGALVVIDTQSGLHDEKTTDALGVVTFVDVGVFDGPAAINAFSLERVLMTLLGADVTTDKRIVLARRNPFSAARVLTGKLLNKVSANDQVAVTSTARGYPKSHTQDSYEYVLANGSQGKIVAFEYEPTAASDNVGVMKAAVTADIPLTGTTLNLDFAKSAPIEHASGSMNLPSGAFAAFQVETWWTKAEGWVDVSLTGDWQVGETELVWHANFFRPFPETETETNFRLGPWPADRTVTHPGYPASPELPFPDPISFVDSISSSLFAPMAWEASSERPDELTLYTVVDGIGEPAWVIRFPSELGQLTLEQPPVAIWKLVDWKESAPLITVLAYCEPKDALCANGECRYATFRSCVRSSTAYLEYPQ